MEATKIKSFGRLTTTCEKIFDPRTVINVQNTSGEIDAVKVRPKDKAVLYYPSLELRKKHQYYYAKIIRAPDETVKGPDEIYMRLRNVTVFNLTTIACGAYTDGEEVDSGLFARAMAGLNARDLMQGNNGVNEAGFTIKVSQTSPDEDLIGPAAVIQFLNKPSNHFLKK